MISITTPGIPPNQIRPHVPNHFEQKKVADTKIFLTDYDLSLSITTLQNSLTSCLSGCAQVREKKKERGRQSQMQKNKANSYHIRKSLYPYKVMILYE